jgi:hypothetical protein
MHLCMTPFVSRLDITELVNKIKMYTNLIKSYHFVPLKKFNILEYHLNKYIYKSSKKIDGNTHVFIYFDEK